MPNNEIGEKRVAKEPTLLESVARDGTGNAHLSSEDNVESPEYRKLGPPNEVKISHIPCGDLITANANDHPEENYLVHPITEHSDGRNTCV